ncbi:MAG: ribonuclease HI [Phycisphaeraceae bacterium]|nr:ribonuclease HI [Phycisphaeraceae bacterium]
MSTSQTKRPRVELFTDGACKFNPGPGGWAYILKHPATGRAIERCGGEAETTNNRMEITALIEGLSALKKPSHVVLYSDSAYVLNAIREWMVKWEKNGWRKKPKSKEQVKNVDLWQRLWELLRTHEVETHWVKGHAGHPENERCDQLASDQALRFVNP